MNKTAKSRTLTAALAALILCAGFLPRLPNLRDPFLSDDWAHLLASKNFSASQLGRLMTPSPAEVLYRPVSAVYYWLNFRMFGLQPAMHRAVKLALYSLCGAGLFWFLLRSTGERTVSGAAALVFLMNPLNTASSVWLATHANVLSFFFCIAALVLFAEARLRRKAAKPLYILFLLAMLLSFGSMELCYGLPALVLAADVLLLRPRLTPRPGFRSMLAWHAPYLLVAGAFLAFRFSSGTGYYFEQAGGGRPLSEIISVISEDVPQTLLIPGGNLKAALPDLAPAVLLLLLLAASIIMRKGAAIRLALFTLPWYAATVPPIAKIFSVRLPVENTRHLFAVSATVGILVGTSLLCLSGGTIRRALMSLGMLCLLGAFLSADLHKGREWRDLAQQSQVIIDTASQTCRGEKYPIRIVFLTYPKTSFNKPRNDPPFVLHSLIVSDTIECDIEDVSWTAYSLIRPDDKPDEKREILSRYLPVRLDEQEQDRGESSEYPTSSRVISLENIGRTFFFFWDEDANTCRDCTAQMRRRLAAQRTADLFVWNKDQSAGGSMLPKLCDSRLEGGVWYLKPPPNSPHPPHLEIELDDISVDDFDELEIVMSVAGMGSEAGLWLGKVAWLLEGEAESPEITNRGEIFVGPRYAFHTLATYHVPLAHRFFETRGVKVKKIFIMLPPDAAEITVRSVRLRRFDVK